MGGQLASPDFSRGFSRFTGTGELTKSCKIFARRLYLQAVNFGAVIFWPGKDDERFCRRCIVNTPRQKSEIGRLQGEKAPADAEKLVRNPG